MRLSILFLTSIFPFLGFSQTQGITEADLMVFMTMTTTEMTTGNKVLQLGNQNHAEIRGTNLSVSQEGDSQHFYYQEATLTPSNVQVEMIGQDNYVEILGNNNITENMSIKVNGDYRSVIIRNYQ